MKCCWEMSFTLHEILFSMRKSFPVGKKKARVKLTVAACVGIRYLNMWYWK